MSGEGDFDLKSLLPETTLMDFPSHGGLVYYTDSLPPNMKSLI